MRHSIAVALTFAVLIAGCGKESMMKVVAPSADGQSAKGYIDLLRERKFVRIEQDIDPGIAPPNLHQVLVGMAAMIPAQNPVSVKVVGASTFRSPGLYRSNITFEYQFADRWLLANVAIQEKDGVSTITGFSINKLSDALENLNRFTLSGKSALQYAVLAWAILATLLSLYALVRCARATIPKRKWLWIASILFGVGQFAVNWTTGKWGVMPLSVQLFSAGASAPPYGAWTLSISLPLGAIWFLLRRKHFSRATRLQSIPPDLPSVER